jgi:hypothetical protein
MIFSSYQIVRTYLPSSGSPGQLVADYGDPTTTSSGEFGGEVVALQLTVNFSDAGLLGEGLGVHFGDLYYVNSATDAAFASLPAVNNMKVRDILARAGLVLGAGPGASASEVEALDAGIDEILAAFRGGTPNQYAQDHFSLTPTASSVPEPSTWGLTIAGLSGLGLVARRRASAR